MAKAKTAYFCQECGYNSPKWVGRCPSCGEWNTFVQEVIEKEDKKPTVTWKSVNLASRPKAIAEIEYANEPRIRTSDQELNRVLGGGIVQGSLILIGGEPGIGKSTLMLQIALTLSDKRVLYVSGEESEQQIKMRAERMTSKSDNCFILTETQTQSIFRIIEEFQPEILIIDSIQTMQSAYIESGRG
jgi:DNA repair protein RadA/Sms